MDNWRILFIYFVEYDVYNYNLLCLQKGLVHKWPKMALYKFFLKSLLVVDNDGALSKSTIKTVKIISLRCYGNVKMNL